MSFQAEKALVRAHYDALAKATPETVAGILAERTSDDWHWRGMHPFYEHHGAKAVADSFWVPFLTAMTDLSITLRATSPLNHEGAGSIQGNCAAMTTI